MKKISIGIPCYNEVTLIRDMYLAVSNQMRAIDSFDYEIIFADNASNDGTKDILKEIAANDPKVKVIFNQANFGTQNSNYNLMTHITGDAFIALPCDFQEPPEMIPQFISYWQEGYKIVWGQKKKSKESRIKYFLRSIYYSLIKLFSSSKQYDQVTGFGLTDGSVIRKWIELKDPTVALRHVIGMWGYEVKLIPYTQNARRDGKSKYNISRYLTFALDSLINTSFVPLRLVTVLGFISSVISFLVGLVYLLYKLIFWNSFVVGIAPMLIGIFLLGSVQLFSIGMLGEYLRIVLKRVSRFPFVIEEELLNFDQDDGNSSKSIDKKE